ncbi:hypothetical protein GCM10017600_56470 [Streptosporangium carneum]|uniref:Uncharacterized protein n=1 Tax=Streptosporangium carneum TaxID=47481 RepID=A0A9W6MFU2_9ACTN|nr:hypothetical protein GCM10017600_56470 [Streptosporangium carneum]
MARAFDVTDRPGSREPPAIVRLPKDRSHVPGEILHLPVCSQATAPGEGLRPPRRPFARAPKENPARTFR